MESEDLDEQLEWEARRITAAFGLKEWEITAEWEGGVLFAARTEDQILEWALDGLKICALAVGDRHNLSSFYITPLAGYGPLSFESSEHDDLMARGLYLLGFEDAFILSKLPPLSMHEKLELRLSFPREFWPQKWLDEDGADY